MCDSPTLQLPAMTFNNIEIKRENSVKFLGNNIEIKRENSVKFLGVIIDEKLNMEKSH